MTQKVTELNFSWLEWYFFKVTYTGDNFLTKLPFERMDG